MLLRNLLETRVIVEIYLFDVVKRQSHTARRDLRKCERDTSEMSVCVCVCFIYLYNIGAM